MTEDPKNEFGQPIGFDLGQGRAPRFPGWNSLEGQYCRLEPLSMNYCEDLFEANLIDDGRMWTYMPYGSFESLSDYQTWLSKATQKSDPQFYAIIDSRKSKAVGVASYLRIDPEAGSIEVGHIAFSPLLQKQKAATEAMFLMMKNAFNLGYRRYEWKCDALNEKSRHAALRLGFTFEGVFRQATHYKGRNRDTAWFSIIDKEWIALEAAFETWLEPGNFDENGKQLKRLSELTMQSLKREAS